MNRRTTGLLAAAVAATALALAYAFAPRPLEVEVGHAVQGRLSPGSRKTGARGYGTAS
jgi:hypothetical protein